MSSCMLCICWCFKWHYYTRLSRTLVTYSVENCPFYAYVVISRHFPPSTCYVNLAFVGFFLKKGGGCHSIRAVFHDRGSLDCDLSGCNQHVRRDFFYAGINSPIHTISIWHGNFCYFTKERQSLVRGGCNRRFNCICFSWSSFCLLTPKLRWRHTVMLKCYCWWIKDVRANCFCASLLRTQIRMPRHAWAGALSNKVNKW